MCLRISPLAPRFAKAETLIVENGKEGQVETNVLDEALDVQPMGCTVVFGCIARIYLEFIESTAACAGGLLIWTTRPGLRSNA